MKEVIINGSAGRLEGKYRHSQSPRPHIVLVLHPHPLHGGTMNNKVVYNTFHTLADNDFSVLRFNFRGVGKSHGEYDQGLGELSDAAAALDWLQLQNPEASSYWIAGFSFGAWIALQLLMRRPELNCFIAISPPANNHDFNFLSPCPAPGLLLQGTKDGIVPEEDVYNLYEKLSKQRNTEIEYAPIEGADHFFKDKLDELKEVMNGYINSQLDSLANLVRKPKKDRRRRQSILEE